MNKKICADLATRTPLGVMGWSYPVFHETKKGAYVDFKAYDPATGEKKRKKYHVDNIKSKKARKEYAGELIAKLVSQLSAGWTPWASADTFRGDTDLNEVLDRYLEKIEKTSRQKTIHSYTSRVNVFREFLTVCPVPVKYAYQYDRKLVNEFLDYLIIDRDVNSRTRNNYKGWCSALGEFMVERKYISENPATGISKIHETEKKRQPLSAKQLRELRKYLHETDKHFLLAVMMEYYTFIRPSELVNLRINDISIKEQSIHIASEFSKNKRDGYVGLNETIIRLMLDLKIFNSPGDWYLFSRELCPGTRKMGADIFNKRWAYVRKALHWGTEYQFYSLKDSGIRDLANERGIVIARDQARHTDISTTNRYLGHQRGVRDETKTFSGLLSTDPDDKTPL